ncbi:hypothetical protein ACG93R_10065 [Acinetobacter guillouiae]|uniref:hypothetical protein n=1 Tax=Acinetobacter guillouiae TaxID=106649 RepID=UPI003AF6B96E
MAYIMVDIEADGPIPGDYSMIALGAVLVEDHLHQQFYGLLKPISKNYIPQALAVSGFSREETLSFNNPEHVMKDFAKWVIKSVKIALSLLVIIMVLTGCLSVGIFIILLAVIRLDLVHKI